MVHCQPCKERGKPPTVAVKVVAGTPMCQSCYSPPSYFGSVEAYLRSPQADKKLGSK